ncbi:hypothetical protein FAZ15_17780 [Sphingobacterium olei]|uniref:DUF2807 domain-containing protein n=1 Tax=Sphingobacterium olei TaxID=2571155 RepID=A0A4U0NGC9_9SPHI|nr:hypothetical protein [Sphingobacterium olei]TJZ53207.1 hypothetical protein FAZ15_17780 [Sphingobacterium olei]
MKLSNKLLITLAIILFVMPISVIYVVTKTNRVDAKEYTAITQEEAISMAVPDKYMRTINVQPFKQVSIVGSNRTSLNLQLVKSKKFAVKVDKGKETDFVYQIDDRGNLELDFQNHDRYNYLSVSIFSPEVEGLSLSKVHLHNFTVQASEFHMKLAEQGDLNFGLNTKIDHLSLKVSRSNFDIRWVDVVGEPFHGVRDLTLDLDSSSIRIHKKALASLNAGIKDSEIAFNLQKDTASNINEMNVTTHGKSAVYLNNAEINQLSGSLSDQTTTDVPVFYLRKLLNK